MNIIERLIEKVKDLNWNVSSDDKKEYYNIGKCSPAGQDFSFDIGVTDFLQEENELTAAELFVEAIHHTYEDYDPSYEAYLWLDDTGHGKNGAPYEMIDVYNDMEECAEMIYNLYTDLLVELDEIAAEMN